MAMVFRISAAIFRKGPFRASYIDVSVATAHARASASELGSSRATGWKAAIRDARRSLRRSKDSSSPVWSGLPTLARWPRDVRLQAGDPACLVEDGPDPRPLRQTHDWEGDEVGQR